MIINLKWSADIKNLTMEENQIIEGFEKEGVVDLDTGYSVMEADDIKIFESKFKLTKKISSKYVLIDLTEVKHIRKATYYLNGVNIGKNTCSNVECKFVVPVSCFRETNSLMVIVTEGVGIMAYEKHGAFGGNPEGYTTDIEEMHKTIKISEITNFQAIRKIVKRGNRAYAEFADGKTAELSFYENGIFRFNMNDGHERIINDLCLAEFYKDNVLCDFELRETEYQATLLFENIVIEITKEPFGMKIQRKGKSDIDIFGNFAENITGIRIPMHDNEAVFGLGESANPHINKRGTTEDVWVSHNPVYCDVPIPYYISSEGYGIYLNSSHHSLFDMGCQDSNNIIISNFDDVLDFFCILNDDAKEIVSSYIRITGDCNLPPKWVFGLWQAGAKVHKSAKDCEEVIESYKEHDIPLDCVCLDPNWQNDFNDLQWNKEDFPEPDKLLEYTRKNYVDVVLWTSPFVNRSCENYDNDLKNHMFFTKEDGTHYPVSWWKGYLCGLIDYTNPETVDKWAERLEGLIKSGVSGFKIDGGDNSEFPYDLYNYNHVKGSELHNLYPLYYAKAYHDTIQRVRPNERSVTWERTGFVGSGKYPCTWGGDQFADFGGLQVLIKAGQQAGICGIPFWAEDVGGFSLSPKTTEEFFIRSWQWGMIAPLSRAHGPKTEPWFYGERALKCIKPYILLRYKLFPYIYSMAYKAYMNRTPMMKPLFYDYFDDAKTYDCDYQYLYGDCFMVAPVYEESGREDFTATRDIYFPQGEWIDYHTGEVIKGKQELCVNVNLNTLPLYIKRGSIIPYTKMKGNTKSYDVNNDLYFEIYPDITENIFDFYDDDGVTSDYKNGKYTHIKLTSCRNTLDLETIKAAYLNDNIFNMDFIIHTDRPKRVTVNDREEPFMYEDGNIKLSVQFDVNEKVKIEWI